jgi:hypothetical protein
MFFQFSFKNEVLCVEKIEKLLPMREKFELQLLPNNGIIKSFENRKTMKDKLSLENRIIICKVWWWGEIFQDSKTYNYERCKYIYTTSNYEWGMMKLKVNKRWLLSTFGILSLMMMRTCQAFVKFEFLKEY